MRGREPRDGASLRRMARASTVAAIDLTFSAPKSVSVLFAVAEEPVPAALVAAHERAVAAARGISGARGVLHAPRPRRLERVRGEGFVAAGYRHRLSRAGDPQLHTHVVVANLTRADGRYTALDAHALYEHKSAAGAVYRAVLRAEVRERLPWVSWRPAGRGLFEIDGLPEPVLRHFSQRRAEIERPGGGARRRRAPSTLSRERMQGIALATRRPKTTSRAVIGESGARRAARAAEHGFGDAELAALSTRADRAISCLIAADGRARGCPARRADRDAQHVRAPARAGRDRRRVPRRRPVARARGDDRPLPRRPQSVASVTGRWPAMRRGSRPRAAGLRATIVESAHRRRDTSAGQVVAGRSGPSRVTSWQPALNDDQATAVRALTSERATASTPSGPRRHRQDDDARQPRRAATRHAGYRVIGTAPTARAARELREVAAFPAGTMHALISDLTAPTASPRRRCC